MKFDFVGNFQAVHVAVVVVENFLVDSTDGSRLFYDEVGLRIEEYGALHSGHSGDFEFQRVAAANFGEGGKTDAELILLGVDEVRIVVLSRGFELAAFRANHGGVFAVSGAVPRGFAVVRLDQVGIAGDELGVITIRQTSVQSVGTGIAIGGAKRAFN